jgi:hypothetical protein
VGKRRITLKEPKQLNTHWLPGPETKQEAMLLIWHNFLAVARRDTNKTTNTTWVSPPRATPEKSGASSCAGLRLCGGTFGDQKATKADLDEVENVATERRRLRARPVQAGGAGDVCRLGPSVRTCTELRSG